MTASLRIALVSAFPPGQQSLNEYGFHFGRALAENTQVAEVIVIADRLDRDQAELDLGPKLRVKRVWNFNRASTSWTILRALRKEAPDAVIWNLQTASFGDREIPAALGLFAPALARMAGFPSGIIAHNIIAGIDLDKTQLQGNKVRQSFVRLGGAVVTRAMMAANYTTVTLRSYLDILEKSYPRANLHLVPHGSFDIPTDVGLAFEKRPPRIVTMGKFGTYKKLETLITAFEALQKDPMFDDLELVIGGSDHPSTPGYMQDMKNRCADNPSVRFLGYIAEEDIPSFFGTARLSVFDYATTTGSSGVLHQTASFGTVPVFPRIGDFVDLCRDEGIDGINYQPLDAQDMARALSSILKSPERANQIAKNNLEAAKELPISEVAAFHVAQINQIITKHT